MPKLRTLRVYPNPYSYIDHEGRPHGSFDKDPDHDNPDAVKIGVKHKAARAIHLRDPKRGDDRKSVYDVLFHYSDEVVLLPDGDGISRPHSVHARLGLREGSKVLETVDPKTNLVTRTLVLPGSLVAADKETADAVGLPFADPIEMLAAARAAAIAKWTADYGEPPAFATDPEYEAHVPPLLRGIKPAPTTPSATTAPATPASKAAASAASPRTPEGGA